MRHDRLRVNAIALHSGDVEVNPGQLKENSLMLAYKPSHRQTVRLQWSRQSARNPGEEAVFAQPVRNAWVLQYVLSFGAHGAHSY